MREDTLQAPGGCGARSWLTAAGGADRAISRGCHWGCQLHLGFSYVWHCMGCGQTGTVPAAGVCQGRREDGHRDYRVAGAAEWGEGIWPSMNTPQAFSDKAMGLGHNPPVACMYFPLWPASNTPGGLYVSPLWPA